ncbi:MAG: helix-hairpin-helix domain-containing protein [Waltera sp.]
MAAYLTPFKVTPKKIRKIYEHFGNEALDVVKTQPFSLCEISGFGFLRWMRSQKLITADPMNRFESKVASAIVWNWKCRMVIFMLISRNFKSRCMNN